MNVYAVLMAGGIGTRFWPRSRRKSPKQVLRILDDRSMIQATVDRLEGLVAPDRTLIVTTAEQKDVIHQQLPRLGEENFIIEPVGRNTAPCIGLAALHIAQSDPDGIMLVLPADHLITDVQQFREVIGLAARFVSGNDGLVTLGITPYEPATGYGYIQSGEIVESSGEYRIHRVRSFAEKPEEETAKRFLASGDFYWNSGMFIWRASTILAEIREKLPAIYEQLAVLQSSLGTSAYEAHLSEAYGAIKGISIDFGVMQKARDVYVIPTEMGWNDVGSWKTVHDISRSDSHGISAECEELINVESSGSFVYAPGKAVALVGVRNLIVVDTGDALLVCRKSSAQNVKLAAEYLVKKGDDRWI